MARPGLEASCCLAPSMAGPGPFQVPFSSIFRSLSVLLPPCAQFLATFLCSQGTTQVWCSFWVSLTCWIELPLQRELDFHLLQGLQFGFLFGHLLCPCQFPFRFWGPIWLLYGLALRPLLSSLDALLRPLGIIVLPWVAFGFTSAQFAAFGVHFWGALAILGACFWSVRCPFAPFADWHPFTPFA